MVYERQYSHSTDSIGAVPVYRSHQQNELRHLAHTQRPAHVEALLSQNPVVPKCIAEAAAPYLAECVGTFTLVFATGCCALAPGDPAWNATAIGCILMVMVYSTSPVSGGNLNPAVSFTLGLVGCLSWPVVLGSCCVGRSSSQLLRPDAFGYASRRPFSGAAAQVA